MRTPWYTQSIHAAIDAHRTIRRRRAMHAQLEAIYGPTVRYGPDEPKAFAYGPPEPLPLGVATELRKAAEFRNEVAKRARRERDARNAYRYARLLNAQRNCCYICSEPFSDERPPTKDHVWPRVRGGQTNRNVLWACFPCNGAKGGSVPEEWMLAKLREINALLDAEPARVYTHPTFRVVR
jgi:HNH endonuclease